MGIGEVRKALKKNMFQNNQRLFQEDDDMSKYAKQPMFMAVDVETPKRKPKKGSPSMTQGN